MFATQTTNIHEAKTHFSRLIERVEKGEEIVIARAGKPLARLSSLRPKRKALPYGLLKGKIKVKGDFDAPLPDDLLAGFEGR